MARLSIYIIALFFAAPALGDNCKVVEYPDHNEVVCEGIPGEYKPEPKGPDGLTQTEREDLKAQIEEAKDRLQKKVADLDRQIEEQKAKAKEDIHLDKFSAIELSRSYGYVTYSLKIDATNPGPKGVLYVKVVAKNRDGHQLDFLYLSGLVNQGDTRTFTNTKMLSYDLASRLYTWEIDEVRRKDQ